MQLSMHLRGQLTLAPEAPSCCRKVHDRYNSLLHSYYNVSHPGSNPSCHMQVTPKTASSVKGNLPVADGLIKAVPGKADQLSLGRTDSALDNPSPRRR